jgi:hypothetical protein
MMMRRRMRRRRRRRTKKKQLADTVQQKGGQKVEKMFEHFLNGMVTSARNTSAEMHWHTINTHYRLLVDSRSQGNPHPCHGWKMLLDLYRNVRKSGDPLLVFQLSPRYGVLLHLHFKSLCISLRLSESWAGEHGKYSAWISRTMERKWEMKRGRGAKGNKEEREREKWRQEERVVLEWHCDL